MCRISNCNQREWRQINGKSRSETTGAATGLAEERHYVWGAYDNYLFRIIQGQGFKQIETYCTGASSDVLEAIRQDLLQHKKELGVNVILSDGNCLLLRYPEGFKSLKQETLAAILAKVTGLLKEKGIPGHDACTQCGGSDNTFIAYVGDIPLSLCDTCFQQLEADFLEAERQHEQADKNYLPGSVGALLGALVGAIPWTIVAYFGFLAAILGFLIGRAALFGYKLFGGIPGRGTKWIVLLAALISLVLAELVILALQIRAEGIHLNIFLFIAVLVQPEVLKAVALDLIPSLLLAGLGVFPLLTDIKAQEKPPRIQKAQV